MARVRTDHYLQDALDIVRSHHNLTGRKYLRRMKTMSEDEVQRIYEQCQADGADFDPSGAARQAIEAAESHFVVGDLPELPMPPEQEVIPDA